MSNWVFTQLKELSGCACGVLISSALGITNEAEFGFLKSSLILFLFWSQEVIFTVTYGWFS